MNSENNESQSYSDAEGYNFFRGVVDSVNNVNQTWVRNIGKSYLNMKKKPEENLENILEGIEDISKIEPPMENLPSKAKNLNIGKAEDFSIQKKPTNFGNLSVEKYEVSIKNKDKNDPKNKDDEELLKIAKKAAGINVRINTIFRAENFKKLEKVKESSIKWRKVNKIPLKSDPIQRMKEEIAKITEAKDGYFMTLKSENEIDNNMKKTECQGLFKNIEVLKDVLTIEELITRGKEKEALDAWNNVPNRLAGIVVEGYELEEIWNCSSWLKMMIELRVNIQLSTSILSAFRKQNNGEMTEREGLNLQMWLDIHEEMKSWNCVKRANNAENQDA